MEQIMLVDLSIIDDAMCAKRFESGVMKTAAYESKITNKATSKVQYTYVAVPVLDEDIDPSIQKKLVLWKSIHVDPGALEIKYLYSLYKYFGEDLGKFRISIDVKSIGLDKVSVFYTDGSSIKNKSGSWDGSYGMVKLNEEVSPTAFNTESIFDSYSEKYYTYETYSGFVVGTNNVGELSGIKSAISNFTDKPVQLIIGDSTYAIGCFRDWLTDWKASNYKHETIKNLNLIKEIVSMLDAKNKKIILFKWTKGHADTQCNELCDELAKKELGLEKK